MLTGMGMGAWDKIWIHGRGKVAESGKGQEGRRCEASIGV